VKRPRFPMLLGATAFASGIAFARYCWRPLLWFTAGAVLLALAGIYFLRRRAWASFALALLALALAGGLALEAEQLAQAARGRQNGVGPFATGEEVMVTAHVLRDATLRVAPGGGDARRAAEDRQMVDVESETITAAGGEQAAAGGIRLAVYQKRGGPAKDEESGSQIRTHPSLNYGDRIRFPAKLREPRNFRNLGAFDYRSYLAREGIFALGSVSADRIERLPGFVGTRLGLWQNRARRSVLRAVAAAAGRAHGCHAHRRAGLYRARAQY